MTTGTPAEQPSGLVVITGGSRGIGAATARRAAAEGWDVRITYRTGEDEARRVVEECRGLGSRADAARVDVTEEDDVLELFGSLPADAGPLRGLVNNAGIVAPAGSVVDLEAGRIRRLLEVNVLGAFLCAREAVRRMTDGGSIVNVSSRAAVLGSPGEYVDYAASKAALDALTTGLAQEVAGRGIRVNGVRPGFIDTGIHAPGRLARVAPSVPMGRAGRAEEVAAAICWLLSPQSSFTTGAFLDVSGGR
ncbi:SDR family oxidoreductase [Nocardioides bizhenqiangii]|uniref:SDR family oxidoreductase n=1 Tax=Nocardioides bizhenqiangii TaxID=3095076 RepID=A0ABZ0ZUP7_9ACTN|nr:MULTISPECIES: SDR family oxidoreductase [unclassified Nocardioides]MDZ5623083.1 SDR family oxidoreductase [Nocardioides sp. HM23]WQQ28061.1 SDR family oxidoreductase [Nocardioides sp. HM61]